MQSTLHFLLVLWLNFIFVPLPPRVVSTYAELLIGAMLSGSGHITVPLIRLSQNRFGGK